MAVDTQDTTIVACERLEAVAGRCGVVDYSSVEDGVRTVELISIEENFGCMDAIAGLAKSKKTVA